MDFNEEEKLEGLETSAEKSKSWKKPLVVIGALFLLFVLILSFVPYYALQENPPPNIDAVTRFELTVSEQASLENVKYEHTASISEAISRVDVADYRLVTSRLVTEACSTHSDLCYAKAVYYYVQTLQYVSDPAYQYVQSPAETMLTGAGDCEDFAFLNAAMLESIGIDSDIGTTSNHAFIRAKVPGTLWGSKYVWLDPTTTNDFGTVELLKKDVLAWYEVA